MTEEPQHLQALREANKIRLGRSDVKKKVAAGKLTLVEAATHKQCKNMTIMELLRSQKRWGTQRAIKWLSKNEIRQRRACGDLTERQLGLLATLDEENANR